MSMDAKKENYNYLLKLYSFVDEYLSNNPIRQENLPEIVVSFCIVTEKIFKIRLHKKNPILVYDNSKIKENDALIAIIKKKELNIETIKIREVLSRYKLMFNNDFSDDEIQVLIDIYNIRNHFVHGYRSDDVILHDEENIVKKMGTVWEKISIQAQSLFGGKLIKLSKPKNKYSSVELEGVLIEEVRKKIKSCEKEYNKHPFARFDASSTSHSSYAGLTELNEEKCPRCGSCGFSKYDNEINSFGFAHSINLYPIKKLYDLYYCKKCNLELTEKEYEIAKKLKREDE